MAEIGFSPMGSAILLKNIDRCILGRCARALVGEIAGRDLHELVRDFCIDQLSRAARRYKARGHGAPMRRRSCRAITQKASATIVKTTASNMVANALISGVTPMRTLE